jgi:hypothetical protein
MSIPERLIRSCFHDHARQCYWVTLVGGRKWLIIADAVLVNSRTPVFEYWVSPQGVGCAVLGEHIFNAADSQADVVYVEGDALPSRIPYLTNPYYTDNEAWYLAQPASPQVRWSEVADPTSWPDDLAQSTAASHAPVPEDVEPIPVKPFEQWLADTEALLAEQRRRRE